MNRKTPSTVLTAEAKPALVPKLRFPEFCGQPWETVNLADVTAECATRNSGRTHGIEVMGVTKAEGIVPMKERVIAADRARYKVVSKNWFAYNPMRLNIGSIARWHGEQDVLVSPDYMVFRCIKDLEHGISPDFLDHFRTSDGWQNFVNECGLGSVRIRIYYKDIAQLELHLPTIAEQQKIADCLSSLDELIAVQARKVDALKTHKKGLMQQLFPIEGETQPHLCFPEFKGEWNNANFGDLCISVSSGKDTRESDGSFDLYGSTGVIGKTASASYNTPHILIARVGANAGHLTMASGQFGVTDNTLVIRLKSVVSIDYIFHYLGNININKLIFGSGQPPITGGILKAECVLLPSASEQLKVSTCLSIIDGLINSESEKLESLKVHKNGLMQQLFPSAEAVAA